MSISFFEFTIATTSYGQDIDSNNRCLLPRSNRYGAQYRIDLDNKKEFMTIIAGACSCLCRNL